MLRFSQRSSTALILTLLFVCLQSPAAQSTAPTNKTPNITLTEAIRDLPAYIDPVKGATYTEIIEKASIAERDAAVAQLIPWLNDERPRVRGLALFSLWAVYMPPETSRVITCDRYLPAGYVEQVGAHLKDPDPRARTATFLALSSVETCGHGMDQLVNLVIPMLRDPDILTEYPDPFFVESNQQMLAHATPEVKAMIANRPVIKLPAEGPVLLSILTFPRLTPTTEVDDAIIAFLDRPDQTKSTLGESLHTLALSRASERVNEEALRRVFEQKAMTVFLLQFISQLRLTPSQLATEKEYLVALSNDASESPALRRAAAKINACWDGQHTNLCQPSPEDFREDSNARPQEKQ